MGSLTLWRSNHLVALGMGILPTSVDHFDDDDNDSEEGRVNEYGASWVVTRTDCPLTSTKDGWAAQKFDWADALHTLGIARHGVRQLKVRGVHQVSTTTSSRPSRMQYTDYINVRSNSQGLLYSATWTTLRTLDMCLF